MDLAIAILWSIYGPACLIVGLSVGFRVAKGKTPVQLSFPAIRAFVNGADVPEKPKPETKADQLKRIDVTRF